MNKQQPTKAPTTNPVPDQLDQDIPLAPKLLSEFFGGTDLDGDGSIFGIDFMLMDSKTKPQMIKTVEETNLEWPNPAPPFEINWDDYQFWATKVSRMPGTIRYLGNTNIGPASPVIKEAVQLPVGSSTQVYKTDFFGIVIYYKATKIDANHVKYEEYLDVVETNLSITREKIYEVIYTCKYINKPKRAPKFS